MEVTFQNKREDFEAFYNYMVKETDQGRAMSKQVFLGRLIRVILVSLLFGFFLWAITKTWQIGLGLIIFMFIFGGIVMLLITGFKPIYYLGMQVYKRQEKSITQRDLQFFQLSRLITIDDNWLEIRSSEAVHRWRWRRVDKIGLTPSFIFIHVGNCPVVYVPKRDFLSEQSFIEFGKKLVELTEKNKDQPFGAE